MCSILLLFFKIIYHLSLVVFPRPLKMSSRHPCPYCICSSSYLLGHVVLSSHHLHNSPVSELGQPGDVDYCQTLTENNKGNPKPSVKFSPVFCNFAGNIFVCFRYVWRLKTICKRLFMIQDDNPLLFLRSPSPA